MRLWVESAGGEQKSADVEWKTVMLIYSYPKLECLLLKVCFQTDLTSAKEATFGVVHYLLSYS
jgi:hypothetical protein